MPITRPALHPSPGEPVRGRGAHVVIDVLLLLVFLQAGGAELTADARLAEAAPLGLRQVGVIVVDPHRAVAQRGGHPFGGALWLAGRAALARRGYYPPAGDQLVCSSGR